jgi:hypothetical protein
MPSSCVIVSAMLTGFFSKGRRILLGKGLFDLFKLLSVTSFASGFFVEYTLPVKILVAIMLVGLLFSSLAIFPEGE